LQTIDQGYRAGYSIYTGVWPLLRDYPGHAFQSGLFGTWMFADNEDPKIDGVRFYSDIEGGLGWWRDTEFPTETPKFIMGAVARGFSAWANGPGAGKGRDWHNPTGLYGVAQLSNRLLWPPDGLNLRQGACGELFGYGYLPLPLTRAKSTTVGAPVQTGDQSWTLFLNTRTFKGPATFVLPYFFAQPTIEEPRLNGMFLDSVPSRPKRGFAMETQHIPWLQATDKDGRLFARMAPTLLPDGSESVVLHQPISYNRQALWDRVKSWFEGGTVASTKIPLETGFAHTFNREGGINWSAKEAHEPREAYVPVETDSHVELQLSDGNTFSFARRSELVQRVETSAGSLMLLPEYYVQVKTGTEDKPCWQAVPADSVPKETGLHEAVLGSRLHN